MHSYGTSLRMALFVACLIANWGLAAPVATRDLGAALINAIQARRTADAKALIGKGANPNARDSNGATPLMFAVGLEPQNELVPLLLKRGAKLDLQDIQGDTALHFACRWENTEGARLLLSGGANPDIRNRLGATPLRDALDCGSVALVRMLLGKGANANVGDTEGVTPLMAAAEGPMKHHARLFAAQLNREKNQPTPEARAAYEALARSTAELMELLLSHGADPNARDKRGWAVWTYGRKAPVLMGVTDILGLLRKAGAKQPPPDVITALDLKDLDELKEALAANTNPNQKDPDGLPAVLRAIILEDGHEFLEVLLEKGADPNLRSANGELPLDRAILTENSDAIALLLSRGANPNLKDDLGETPLMYAVGGPASRRDIVLRLLEQGGDLRATNGQGETLTMLAGSAAVLELLLDKGADPNAKSRDGLTPLMYAVAERRPGNLAQVKLLLARGAQVNARNAEGVTALLIAAHCERFDVLALLLKHGADPNLRSKYGASALMHAAENGSVEATRALLAHKADPNAKSTDGDTALKLATAGRHAKVVRLLKAAGAKR